MTVDLFVILGALVAVVILGTLGKIHGQINELLTILKNLTTSEKRDSHLLMSRMEDLENKLDLMHHKLNPPEPDEIKWEG